MLAGLWGEGRAPIPLELVPLSAGEVFDAGEFTVDCFPVRHRDTDSFAFAFQARRHLLPERLAALGVPDGPARGDLAAGRPVALQDGRTIDPEDVLGPPARGTKVVVIGDTETTDDLSEHVRGADLLVIEATFLERDAAMARDYGHLTAAKAAGLAAAAGVKRLVLTHISGRYENEKILAEASKVFASEARWRECGDAGTPRPMSSRYGFDGRRPPLNRCRHSRAPPAKRDRHCATSARRMP
jgi:ribonuclease Z